MRANLGLLLFLLPCPPCGGDDIGCGSNTAMVVEPDSETAMLVQGHL